MSAVHYAASWILAGAVLLHIAGALKHALVHRDGMMARMGVGAQRASKVPLHERRASLDQ